MNRISIPYHQQTYQTSLTNHSNELESHKAELKQKLSELILTKTRNGSEDNLTDTDYRDILNSLHNTRASNGNTFHQLLNNAGIKTVSKYSWFSNQRATGKIEALKKYLGLGDSIKKDEQEPLLFRTNKETANLVSAPLKLKDIHGQLLVSEKIALPAGPHSIKLQHGRNKGKMATIKTGYPIYFFKNAQFAGMEKPAHCIVMKRKDFIPIKNTIHPDAFGDDYCDLKNGLVAVWKHPADLLHIDGYNQEPVPVDVGTYGFCNDLGDRSKLPVEGRATKMRTDIKNGKFVVSVHQFVGDTNNGDSFDLPGISTGSFFSDFYNPQPEERHKVRQMIKDLEDLGIYAFMSNATHHAVIIYACKDDNGERQTMTPSVLARQLQDNPKILGAISKAAKENKDMGQWQSAFIKVFGTQDTNIIETDQ